MNRLEKAKGLLNFQKVEKVRKDLELTMTQQPRIPDPETRARTVARLREACQMLDALNLFLDDALAQVEAENRQSPLYVYRLHRAKRLLDSRCLEKSEEKGGA